MERVVMGEICEQKVCWMGAGGTFGSFPMQEFILFPHTLSSFQEEGNAANKQKTRPVFSLFLFPLRFSIADYK